MQSTSDIQLLRSYATDGSEAAFAELARRHADLVYSAALRQVDSPDLARDVAQQVFTDLARKAGQVATESPDHASIVGWLYRGVRYEALDLRRTELRRRHREQQAMQLLDSADDSPDWTALGPQLDAAMEELDPTDRDALLLRFFQNHDLRAVGTALGVSDDAAQKRVSRAVERLRTVLQRRGVTASLAGLTVAISAHAVQAAPVGLTTALVTASIAATPAALVATTVQTIAMTATQKILLATVLTAALGTGVYEAHNASSLRHDIKRFGEERRVFEGRITDLKVGLTGLTNLVASLNAENDRLQAQAIDGLKLHRQAVQLADKTQREVSGADPDVQEALRWKANKEKLHHLFADRPDQWIPELALMGDDGWLDAGRGADLDSEDGIRRAMSGLRQRVENQFVIQLSGALTLFQKAHGGGFPESVSDLAGYLQPPADASWLTRYAVMPGDQFPSHFGDDSVIVQKTAIDEENDMRWILGAHGITAVPFRPDPNQSAIDLLRPVVSSYAAEHAGREPASPSDVEPYLKTAEQRAAYQTMKDVLAKKFSEIRK